MIPILAVGMMWIYFCKRAIILKYSVKIPADEGLNESIIGFIPLILLGHSFFSVWSHTAEGVFQSGAPILSLDIDLFGDSTIDRIFDDALILGEAVFFIIVVIIDYTLISFFGWLRNCCKDDLEVPI